MISLFRKKAKTTARLHPRLPHLPHDIIYSGILPRLPVKTLFRFKCVCKLWNATIDDPDFIKLHWMFAQQNSSTSSILGLYQLQKKDSESVHYYFVTKDAPYFFRFHSHKTTKLIGQCNGLFSFSSDHHFMICNPSTREHLWRRLPPPPPCHHPNLSYGFGFDSLTNEYKLVQIVHANQSIYRCMVYAMGAKSNSWREIVVSVNLSCHIAGHIPRGADIGGTMNSGRATHINGTLFWFFHYPHLFMSFDLHSEKFNFFQGPMPKYPFSFFFRQSGCCGFLMELQGHLCLAFQNRDGDVLQLYTYDQPSAYGWELKVLNLQYKSALRVGALSAESLLHSFTAEGVIAYPLEGLDDRHHNLIGSKLAKLPLLPGKYHSLVKEYWFSYHVENLVSLKSLMGTSP